MKAHVRRNPFCSREHFSSYTSGKHNNLSEKSMAFSQVDIMLFYKDWNAQYTLILYITDRNGCMRLTTDIDGNTILRKPDGKIPKCTIGYVITT